MYRLNELKTNFNFNYLITGNMIYYVAGAIKDCLRRKQDMNVALEYRVDFQLYLELHSILLTQFMEQMAVLFLHKHNANKGKYKSIMG